MARICLEALFPTAKLVYEPDGQNGRDFDLHNGDSRTAVEVTTATDPDMKVFQEGLSAPNRMALLRRCDPLPANPAIPCCHTFVRRAAHVPAGRGC